MGNGTCGIRRLCACWVVVLAMLVTGFVGCGSSALSDSGWGTALDIGSDYGTVDPDSDASTNRYDVAFDIYGNAMAVWCQETPVGSYIYSSYYKAGVGWGAAEMIPGLPGEGFCPDIDMDGSGNAWVVCHAWDGSYWSIYACFYQRGYGWHNWQVIDYNTFDALYPRIGVDKNSNAVAVWFQTYWYGGDFEIRIFSNSFSAAVGWGSDSVPLTSIFADRHPDNLCVVMNWDGTATATWIGWYTGWSAFANRWEDGSWQGEIVIDTSDAGRAWSPRVAMDGSGNAIAVWHQILGGDVYSICANRYDAGASTWEWPHEVLENLDTGNAVFPDIAFDDAGNAMAVWVQQGATHEEIWANRCTAGSSWDRYAAVEITDQSGWTETNAANPRVAMDPAGNAVAVWYQYLSKNDIWANTYSVNVGWGLPLRIETFNEGGCAYPRIESDSSGNAVVVWAAFGNVPTMMANRYVMPDTTAPLLGLYAPENGATTSIPVITVSGWIDDPDAQLSVNGVLVAVDAPSSTFSVNIALVEGTNSIALVATDLTGNEGYLAIEVFYNNPIPGLQAQLETLTQDLANMLAELNGIEDDLLALQTEVDGIETDLTSLQNQVATLQTDLNGLESDLAALESDLASLLSQMGELESDLGNTSADAVALQTQLDATRSLLSATRSLLNTTQEDLDATQSEVDDRPTQSSMLMGLVAVGVILLAIMSILYMSLRKTGGTGKKPSE